MSAMLFDADRETVPAVAAEIAVVDRGARAEICGVERVASIFLPDRVCELGAVALRYREVRVKDLRLRNATVASFCLAIEKDSSPST